MVHLGLNYCRDDKLSPSYVCVAADWAVLTRSCLKMSGCSIVVRGIKVKKIRRKIYFKKFRSENLPLKCLFEKTVWLVPSLCLRTLLCLQIFKRGESEGHKKHFTFIFSKAKTATHIDWYSHVSVNIIIRTIKILPLCNTALYNFHSNFLSIFLFKFQRRWGKSVSLILDGWNTEVYEAADSDSSLVSIRALHDIKKHFQFSAIHPAAPGNKSLLFMSVF